MEDRLQQFLDRHDVLYGVICRDPTSIDIEQIAQVGYHIVWIDLEHAPLGWDRVAELCQLIRLAGMVPQVRVMEVTRGQVQNALDCGAQMVTLPQTATGDQARQLVQLGKFPPVGRRGVACTVAGIGYTFGDDPLGKLADVNATTHLMVQIENDEGLENLDDILSVEAVDLVTAGPADWAVTLGVFGASAKPQVGPRVEKVFTAAVKAGKTVATVMTDPQLAARHVDLGARIVFVGVDTILKRRAFGDALKAFTG